jgi:hypothetical protein
MVENTEGKVALKYMTTNQKLVTAPSGNQYVFVPKHNISMAWVEKKDAGPLVGMKKGCKCGSNSKKQVIFYAQDHDVRRWYNGGR